MPFDKLHSISKIKKKIVNIGNAFFKRCKYFGELRFKTKRRKGDQPKSSFFLMEKKSNIHLSQLPKASRSKKSNLFKFDCRTLFSGGPSIQVDGF